MNNRGVTFDVLFVVTLTMILWIGSCSSGL